MGMAYTLVTGAMPARLTKKCILPTIDLPTTITIQARQKESLIWFLITTHLLAVIKKNHYFS
jgi:hypothetical protein